MTSYLDPQNHYDPSNPIAGIADAGALNNSKLGGGFVREARRRGQMGALLGFEKDAHKRLFESMLHLRIVGVEARSAWNDEDYDAPRNEAA